MGKDSLNTASRGDYRTDAAWEVGNGYHADRCSECALWVAPSAYRNEGHRSERGVALRRRHAARSPCPHAVELGKGQETDLAAALMSGHGTALVAWQHEEIPTIVAHLGSVTPLPPPQWSADRFDVVWVFARTVAGWTFRQVPQLLLAGDRADVIL